jgi:DNA-binding transcriptional MerR regulator
MRTQNVVAAFSDEQVERLAGVSRQQLRYWDKTGFFRPAFASEDRRDAYSRIYSFRNVASLRVLNVLRNQYNVPLQHLRKVADELGHLSDAKWIITTLFVLNRKVIFVEKDTAKYREIVSRQYIIDMPLSVVVSDTRRDIEALSDRTSAAGKIDRARFVNHNAPVIAGTRIPVATIKQFSEEGYSVEQILAEYPTLTAEDVRAAVAYEGDGIAA